MENFKKHLKETISYSSSNRDDFKREELFNNNKDKMKLVKSLNGFDVYKMKEIFFLSKNGIYKGYIDSIIDTFNSKKAIFISQVSVEERGTYKIFIDILLRSGYFYVISDLNLSEDATKFYKKALENTSWTKVIIKYNKEIIFNKKEYSKEEIHNILNDGTLTIAFIKE